jgi:hypothetical protein
MDPSSRAPALRGHAGRTTRPVDYLLYESSKGSALLHSAQFARSALDGLGDAWFHAERMLASWSLIEAAISAARDGSAWSLPVMLRDLLPRRARRRSPAAPLRRGAHRGAVRPEGRDDAPGRGVPRRGTAAGGVRLRQAFHGGPPPQYGESAARDVVGSPVVSEFRSGGQTTDRRAGAWPREESSAGVDQSWTCAKRVVASDRECLGRGFGGWGQGTSKLSSTRNTESSRRLPCVTGFGSVAGAVVAVAQLR